jgi:hypothetical protein
LRLISNYNYAWKNIWQDFNLFLDEVYDKNRLLIKKINLNN